MELKRKVAMVVVTLSVALGTGHIMQGGLAGKPARNATGEKPVSITPLSAGIGSSGGARLQPAAPTARPIAEMETALAAPPARPQLDRMLTMEPVADPVLQAAFTTEAPTGADLPTSLKMPADSSAECPLTLGVNAAEGATLEISLFAPCHAGERVVLRHGGLALTARAAMTGSLFVALPGMEAEGKISVLFNDGSQIDANAALRDLPQYRRFGIQWLAADAFQLNAFENGADYGQPGHVSATDPHRSVTGAPTRGGHLSLLGDDSVDLPMLAEVYTYPADPLVPVNISIEAEVSPATCNRELLAELLSSADGRVTTTDLTLAMPECDAVGDVLVLNNPLSELTLATAN